MKDSVQGCAEGDGAVDLERDRALVRRCQDGDGTAFAELYTLYHGRLRRFCARRLTDRDEADEITQEAFLRAWRSLPTFGGGRRFYPWLTVIAKNLCTDHLRRRARATPVEDIDRPDGADTRVDLVSVAVSSEEAVMAAYDASLAVEAMGRLSERHRNVLRLREEAGLSYQEIATREGVGVSTVETLLWRARQALRREYAALSGTRVLGGLLVATRTLRRLAGRAARPAVRLAELADGVRPRDILAACVVTATVATVSVAPGPPARAPDRPAAASTRAVSRSGAPGEGTAAGAARPDTAVSAPPAAPAPSPAAPAPSAPLPVPAPSGRVAGPPASSLPVSGGTPIAPPAAPASAAPARAAPAPPPVIAQAPSDVTQLLSVTQQAVSAVVGVVQPVVSTVDAVVQGAPIGPVLSLLGLG